MSTIRNRYFHWKIEFPEVFRDKYGNKLENPGFDAIVGNPLIELAEQIMTAKQGNPKADLPTEEKQIDKLVYDLYRLTPTEIGVVKSSIGQDEKS